MVQKAAAAHYVVDKGHKHSDGKSEVVFMIDARRTPDLLLTGSVHDDVTSMALLGLQSQIEKCKEKCKDLLETLSPPKLDKAEIEVISEVAFDDYTYDWQLVENVRASLQNFSTA